MPVSRPCEVKEDLVGKESILGLFGLLKQIHVVPEEGKADPQGVLYGLSNCEQDLSMQFELV